MPQPIKPNEAQLSVLPACQSLPLYFAPPGLACRIFIFGPELCRAHLYLRCSSQARQLQLVRIGSQV